MDSIARMDSNYPQNFRMCPGLPLRLLARNSFFQSDRPEPLSPLKLISTQQPTAESGYVLGTI